MVYLDELLLVNFAAAGAFLLAAGLLCGLRCSPARLLAGSAAGAASALALLLPEAPWPLALGYKAAACAAMVALCYGWPGARGFLALCGWVLALGAALTGAALLPGAAAEANNFSLYARITPGALLLGCGALAAGAKLCGLCFGRPGRPPFSAALEIGGQRVSIEAFCDTGFDVQDAFTGREVVLLRYEAVRGQLAAPLRGYLDACFKEGAPPPAPPAALGVRLVLCATIAGERLLPAVPARALGPGAGRRAPYGGELVAAFAARLPAAGWSALAGERSAEILRGE